jgi:hypothetical protein
MHLAETSLDALNAATSIRGKAPCDARRELLALPMFQPDQVRPAVTQRSAGDERHVDGNAHSSRHPHCLGSTVHASASSAAKAVPMPLSGSTLLLLSYLESIEITKCMSPDGCDIKLLVSQGFVRTSATGCTLTLDGRARLKNLRAVQRAC